jgi:peptide methionine sulfoxide reductase MsrA
MITGLLVIFNLDSVTGNAISNCLFNLISPLGFMKSATDMNTFYTATLFSVLSFSATKVLQRWKETKQQRIENKQALLKLRATKLMSSKELLDSAREKDLENYRRLK